VRALDDFLPVYEFSERHRLANAASTETRVHVPDPAARGKFRRYWLVIRPFSCLIRVFLRATRRRAEVST
jgi:hypothetical protein